MEAEGKLYSVPEDVEMLTPPQGELEQWWKVRFGTMYFFLGIVVEVCQAMYAVGVQMHLCYFAVCDTM